MKEIHHAKKINDSYKLLKGKYFSVIQRENNVKAKRKLLLARKNCDSFLSFSVFCNDEVLQKVLHVLIIAKNNKKEAKIGK